jgi:hypothetical protein
MNDNVREKRKKSISTILIFIALIVALGVMFGTVDYIRVKNGKLPIFTIHVSSSSNWNKYYGLGYVVTINEDCQGDYVKFGPYFASSACFLGSDYEMLEKQGFSQEQKEDLLDSEREHKLNRSINLRNLNNDEKKVKLGTVIKEKIDSEFNASDYVIDVSQMESDEEITKIYDLTLAIAGAKMGIGYTVFVKDNDTMIESIFNNMKGYRVVELKEKYEDTIKSKIDNLSKSKIENMRKKVLEGSTWSKDTITIINEGKRYDLTTNKLYYTICYEGVDQLEGESDFAPPMWADVYEEEI